MTADSVCVFWFVSLQFFEKEKGVHNPYIAQNHNNFCNPIDTKSGFLQPLVEPILQTSIALFGYLLLACGPPTYVKVSFLPTVHKTQKYHDKLHYNQLLQKQWSVAQPKHNHNIV